MNTTETNPYDLAAAMMASWSAYVARDSRPGTPHPYVYASAWRPCTRRMVLEMTQPEALPAWTSEQFARFRRGLDRERDLLVDLTRAGRDSDPPFTVLGQQERFELRDHRQRPAIVGKVDAQIRIDGGASVPLEVKAWSPALVDRIHTFADLFESPWTRSGAHQLLAYLFGKGVPYGFLLLDRSGLPLLLPVELYPHLDRLEAFLAQAETALDHRDAGTLPPYLEHDAAECRRCPFYGAVCNPPTSDGQLQVLTDPELEALLTRREALDAAATEYDRIDKDIKGRLRGIDRAVAGPFLIEGKWTKATKLDLPAALKAQYTTTDPKGRFTLTVTRL